VSPPATGPKGPACVIAYRLASGPGQPFAATLTVTNTGQSLAPGWRLSFALPAGDGSLRSQRIGDTMASALDHGDSVPLTITGPAAVADPQPGSFRVNEQPCLSVPFPSVDPNPADDPGPPATGIAVRSPSTVVPPFTVQAHIPKAAKNGQGADASNGNSGNDNAGNGKKAS
jgi:hypothetical protein